MCKITKLLASFLILAVVAVAVFLGNIFTRLDSDTEPPEIKDGWFGRGPAQPESDVSIRPFKVQVPDKVLVDLKERLDNARLGEDLENTEFQYGFQVNLMKKYLSHWKTSFDWRKQEKELNKFPHFKTRIEGIDVHFMHIKRTKGKKDSSRVLLMSHGWPGSVWEFYKIIPMLTNPSEYGGNDDEAFEVICPSIPGYGFSEAPHQKGFNAIATARIYKKLMSRLGHEQFYIQGGDWGGLIFTLMAQAYPETVRGVHLNMFPGRTGAKSFLKNIVGSYFPSLLGITPEEYARFYPLSKTFTNLLKATGYMHIQATKPDTVAFGLNDSPVGLAAYILEKFGGWTNPEFVDMPDGGITRKFNIDDLLTNVMIYWVTGSIGSSMRYYKENFGFTEEMLAWNSVPVTVPTGLAEFPFELFSPPEAILKSRYVNIVQFSRMPRGGHFAAMEEPKLLAEDIFSFVRKVENGEGKVPK